MILCTQYEFLLFSTLALFGFSNVFSDFNMQYLMHILQVLWGAVGDFKAVVVLVWN